MLIKKNGVMLTRKLAATYPVKTSVNYKQCHNLPCYPSASLSLQPYVIRLRLSPKQIVQISLKDVTLKILLSLSFDCASNSVLKHQSWVLQNRDDRNSPNKVTQSATKDRD